VVKCNFTNSKLRETYFITTKLIGKYQISKSRGGNAARPTPMDMSTVFLSRSVGCRRTKLRSAAGQTW